MTISASDSPNTRISQLRTWLSRPPSAAKDLTLRATSGPDAPDVQLGTWASREVVPELAAEIVLALDEHCATVGGPVTARLAFLAESGAEVKVKQINRSPIAMQAPERLDEVTLDGSGRSQVVQAQAMAQSFAQLMLRSNAVVLQQSVALSQQAGEVARALADEAVALRARLRAEQDAAERLRDALAAPESANEEGGAALAEMLRPHMPLLVQLVAQALAKAPPGATGV